MENIVIIDSIRTPMGHSKGGVFRQIRAEELSAHLMTQLLSRNPALNNDKNDIDDIILGCVQQTLEQGFNIVRNAALLTDIPHTVPAVTVNRLCGSSMQALYDAAHFIMSGDANVVLVGGVEHMGHVPMTHGIDINSKMSVHVSTASASMGLTTEMLARQHQISRVEQDEFALRSLIKKRLKQLNRDGLIMKSWQLWAMTLKVIWLPSIKMKRFDLILI